MFRFILLIAAALIIGQLLRIGLRQLRGPEQPRRDQTDAFEPMTQCPHCGVHLPEGTLDGGGICPECRQ